METDQIIITKKQLEKICISIESHLHEGINWYTSKKIRNHIDLHFNDWKKELCDHVFKQDLTAGDHMAYFNCSKCGKPYNSKK